MNHLDLGLCSVVVMFARYKVFKLTNAKKGCINEFQNAVQCTVEHIERIQTSFTYQHDLGIK